MGVNDALALQLVLRTRRLVFGELKCFSVVTFHTTRPFEPLSFCMSCLESCGVVGYSSLQISLQTCT